MGLMGKLRVVLVKKTTVQRERDEDRDNNNDDRRFRRPGRIDRIIENGKEYRTVSYDETRPIDDLLPDETKKQDTSEPSKQLDYVLILNFGTPVPKS